MGKLEANKQQKLTSLLNTAFNLFTTQGVTKTSIAEISQKAGIAIFKIIIAPSCLPAAAMQDAAA